MNVKVTAIATGTALVTVLGVMQAEISVLHEQAQQTQEDVREIKEFLIKRNDPIVFTGTDIECLAKNIYHEAGVENIAGKFAVAQVTLNRVNQGKWGNTICDVVYSKAQFSWTLSKQKLREEPKGQLWDESMYVARQFLFKGYRVPSLEKSTYYHAEYVDPKWNRKMKKVEQVGRHLFYETI